MFDNLFGGMFDFNRDGHTDFAEQAVGFAIMEEMMKEEERKNSLDDRRDEFDDFESDW